MVLSVIKYRLIYNFLGESKSQSRISGSRVMAILLNKWISPIGKSGEASWWRVGWTNTPKWWIGA